MARVSRMTATSRSKPEGYQKNNMTAQASEFSITTLRSEQEEEEKVTCAEWCANGLKSLFNFTIASCECFICLKKQGSRYILDSASSVEDVEMALLKEKLKFHFMNPFEKWRYPKRRRFPWKLLVQLASIILVTTQLILFASTKFALTNFITENQATFTKLFVQNPQGTDPDDPLPSPITNLYTHEELKAQVNHTIDQYFRLNTLALGTYGYSWQEGEKKSVPRIEVVMKKYDTANIDPAAKLFNVSKGTFENHTIIQNYSDYNLDWDQIRAELSQTIYFTLHFNITAILVHSSNHIQSAECVQFHLELMIENNLVSGSMPVTLKVTSDISKCTNNTGPYKSENVVLSNSVTSALDGVVMVFAFISILQCLRSLAFSWKLSREVSSFFLRRFGYRLKFHQLLPLYNKWFLGVIVSNLLVVVGCILKLLIAYNVITSLEVVDITSIIVGLAVFGQWCGLLRFLSYLDKYNMLLITLRLSLPSVFRFVICTGILYIAFLLCGWLVLGPYHPKFRDPFVTSDCLFSLINGDDMFATYKGMSTSSQAAYIFSKVYLYVFIALFIYVVLSVFISLISDTYETLHEHWYERSKGLLVDFATGKLAQPHDHYHHPASAGHSHVHAHADTEILHDDKTEEEDYEYLREASNRYGPVEDRPLIINGGPELLLRRGRSDSRPGSRAAGEQPNIPHVHVRTFTPDLTDSQGTNV